MKNTLLFTRSPDKHSGTFANRHCEERSHPKNPNVRPHSVNSIENATPL